MMAGVRREEGSERARNVNKAVAQWSPEALACDTPAVRFQRQ